ncbi:MAG: phospholipase D-like domain-containing protein [Alphaproteobacteria bacterium]|nr:phospholipase D-like domain-containing protein [Alphaproteobacteria bacterium]
MSIFCKNAFLFFVVFMGQFAEARSPAEQRYITPDRLIVYPKHDGRSARDSLIQEINQATETIQMSAYQIKDTAIVDSLIGRAKSGVTVELVVEEDPYRHDFNKDNSQKSQVKRLLDAGVRVYGRPLNLKERYPTGHYHARYILIDSKRFIITTGNFDETTFDHCRDFAVAFSKKDHPGEFSLLERLFEKDAHNELFPDMPPLSSVIIGPDHNREKIIAFLRTAQKTIKLYQQYLNDPEIVKVIGRLIKEKGIKVDVIIMPYPIGYDKQDPNAVSQDQLKAAGADVRLILDLYAHARAVIVDDRYAFVGTTSLSPPCLDNNREVNLLIQGPIVEKMVEIFEDDQQQAVSLEEGRKKALETRRDWNLVSPQSN